MRIIAGSSKGHRLRSPKGDRIRPTSDRVREAIFSMLGDIRGASVVDAFAGSGAMGLEALSRGAKRCYFFDPSSEAISLVEENARRTKLADRCRITGRSFLEGFPDAIDDTPDLWFLDPPYGTDLARRALEMMDAHPEIVTGGALAVWESGVDEPVLDPAGFSRARVKEYGTTRVMFLRRIDSRDSVR